MLWLETVAMQQRMQFLVAYQDGMFIMTELCARFGVSRKTRCKRLTRYANGGPRDFGARGCASQHCPHRIAETVAELICRRFTQLLMFSVAHL